MRYPCRDMRGRVHDGDVLRKRRVKAMGKGMNFLYRYFKANRYAALYDVGDDAPSIFFEIWYTCGNSTIRSKAKDMALHLTSKLQARMLAHRADRSCIVKQRDEFFALMFLLRSEHEMGMDTAEALAAADELFKRNGFRDTQLLFGYSREGLEHVSTAAWLELVVRILIMDYNNMLYPKRFPTAYGLRDALSVLRCHRLSGPPMDKAMHFQDSFYLATHIVYATSAYSGVKTFESDAPWLYRYIRRALSFWMGQARLKRRDESVYVDVDGVGEALDNLRGTGLTEVTDPMVCEGTVWLLDAQLKNGSWPVWFEGSDNDSKHDYYDRMHATWVCTQALRDRDFKVNEAQVRQWRVYVEKVLKETQLAVQGWSNKKG